MKNFKSAILFAALTATLALGPQALACPPQPGTETLTFSRIMMNFGRMTLKADTLVREMNQHGQSKETPALAVEDLGVAISCAQIAVAAAQAPDITLPEVAILLPTGVQKCTPEVQVKFLDHYYKMMSGFTRLLEQYQEQIRLADYANAASTAEKIKNVADTAHNQLNPGTYCEHVLARKRK